MFKNYSLWLKMVVKNKQLFREPDIVEITGNVEISSVVHLKSHKRNVEFIPGQAVKITVQLHKPPCI